MFSAKRYDFQERPGQWLSGPERVLGGSLKRLTVEQI
jgi:hypothetical protein